MDYYESTYRRLLQQTSQLMSEEPHSLLGGITQGMSLVGSSRSFTTFAHHSCKPQGISTFSHKLGANGIPVQVLALLNEMEYGQFKLHAGAY